MKPECEKCSLTYSLTDHSFERNGFRIHLDRMVRGGTEPKRQILLVHGLTYSSHEFDINYKDYSLVRFLARNGYAVWRIDITGYGQSERISDGFLPNSDYAAEDINAAVREIVRISGAEKIDVLGWSWGTVTSGRFAARYPEHLNRLVLYAPVIMGHAKRDVTEPFHHNDWVHAAGDFQLDENGGYDYDIVEPVIVEMFCSSCWHYDGDFSPNGGRRDIMNGFEPLVDVSAFTRPTLLIYGDRDPALDYDRLKAAMDVLPEGSEAKEISGAAHAMLYEKPYYRRFQDAILAYLNKE